MFSWYKYEYSPEISYLNPTLTFYPEYSNGKYTWIFTSDKIDFTTMGDVDNILLFLKGFYYINNPDNEFMISNSVGYPQLYFYYGGEGISGGTADHNCVHTIEQHKFTIKPNNSPVGATTFVMQYIGTKIIQKEIKNYIGIVYSNNENAYPYNGLQDGYWYKKEIKSNVIDVTSGDDGSISFEHSLGKIPDWIYICLPTTGKMEGGSTNSQIVNLYIKPSTISNPFIALTVSINNQYGSSTVYGTFDSSVVSITKTETNVNISRGTGYGATSFKPKTTYTAFVW